MMGRLRSLRRLRSLWAFRCLGGCRGRGLLLLLLGGLAFAGLAWFGLQGHGLIMGLLHALLEEDEGGAAAGGVMEGQHQRCEAQQQEGQQQRACAQHDGSVRSERGRQGERFQMNEATKAPCVMLPSFDM